MNTPTDSSVINPTWQTAMSTRIGMFEKKNKRPPNDVEMRDMEASPGMPVKFASAAAVKGATPETLAQSNAAGVAAASAGPPIPKGGSKQQWNGLTRVNPTPAQVAPAAPTAAPPMPAVAPAPAPVANPAAIPAAVTATMNTATAAAAQTAGGPAAPMVPPAVGQALASAMPPPPRNPNAVQINPALWTPEAIAQSQNRANDPAHQAYRANPYNANSRNPSNNYTPGATAPASRVQNPASPATAAPPTIASRVAAMDKQYPAIAAASTNSKVPDFKPQTGAQFPTAGETRATLAAIDQKYRPGQPSQYAPSTVQGIQINKPAFMQPPAAQAPTATPTAAPPALATTAAPITPAIPPSATAAPTAAPAKPGFFAGIANEAARSFGTSPFGKEIVGAAKGAVSDAQNVARGVSRDVSTVAGATAQGLKSGTKVIVNKALQNPSFRGSQFANYLERKIPSAAPPRAPRSLVLR